MNRINISILVSTLLGISLVDVMPLCLFPGETVLEVQPDGSTTCVCDTLNHYCGPRDDMCYLVKCEGNKILLQSCSCVCPPNYTENTNGECIPDQPSSEPLRCKSGEVVLLNGQCGLPSTTTRVTTTTASPTVRPNAPDVNTSQIASTYAILTVKPASPDSIDLSGIIALGLYKMPNKSLLRYLEYPTETNRYDTEIRLSDLTPNTTYKIEVRIKPYEANGQSEARTLVIRTKYDLTDGNRTLTDPNSMNLSWFHVVLITAAAAFFVCLAILIGLFIRSKRRNNPDILNNNNNNNKGRQSATVDRPDFTSTDQGVRICLDTNAEGTGTIPKDTNPTETEDNKGPFTDIGCQESQGPLYPALPKTDNRVTDTEQTDDLYKPTSNGSVQRAGTGRDVIDPEETKSLLSWKKSSYTGGAHDSDENSQEMDTLSKSLFSDHSDSAVDETIVKTAESNTYSVDRSIPDDNSYSHSFPCLVQESTGHIAQPNTHEANHKLLFNNQIDSQPMSRAPIQVQPEDVNQRQDQTSGICMETLPSINSLQRPGNTQPTSSSYVNR